MLQVLYKLKTAKIFDKSKTKSGETEGDPFAIEIISLCPESRKLCVAGASSHVILFSYKKTESNDEVTVLEIPIIYEVLEEGEVSPDGQFSGPGSVGSGGKIDFHDFEGRKVKYTKILYKFNLMIFSFFTRFICSLLNLISFYS